MTVRILVGDCRDTLKRLPDESVNLVVTSPPFWGLRAYSVEPTVWGGVEGCRHEWGGERSSKSMTHQDRLGDAIDPRTGQPAGGKVHGQPGGFSISQGQFCLHCPAWLGTLGNEPTIDLYVANLVGIFREVRRVLHPSGCLVLNLGDSFSSSTTSKRPNGKGSGITGDKAKQDMPRPPVSPGLKPKDLVGVPWAVAFALRADGWWLRSEMVWIKKNPMPSSVRDRPSVGHEHIFLLAKSKKYYWDAEAIRKAHTTNPLDNYRPPTSIYGQDGRGVLGREKDGHGGLTTNKHHPSGRNYRTTDPWFASLDDAIEHHRQYLAHLESIKAEGGLMLNEQGNPLALQVNTKGYKGAHFATFPCKLVHPFILAGSSKRGVCPACYAPWERAVEKIIIDKEITKASPKYQDELGHGTSARVNVPGVGHAYVSTSGKTTGWTPSCACSTADPIPATVLDPFSGAGTTLMVSDREGRDTIGCELSGPYAKMAHDRIKADGGMFTQVRIE